MTAADFNLRGLARETVRTAESVDYYDLANALLSQLTPKQYRVALAQVLPVFMRDVAGSLRHPGPVHVPASASAPTLPKMPGSWKVQAIRDGWQRRLTEIYAGVDGNKRLGDFTHDDLIHQSDILQAQAKQKQAKAKGWRSLADAITEAGVERVRDLPAETLMVALGAVA